MEQRMGEREARWSSGRRMCGLHARWLCRLRLDGVVQTQAKAISTRSRSTITVMTRTWLSSKSRSKVVSELFTLSI